MSDFNRLPISAVILTKNEERNISDCIDSLQEFDQIFVVDSQSHDKTKQIAHSKSTHVIDFIWNGKYPKKKQWCLDNLNFKNSWILFLDADERISISLKNELHTFLKGVDHEYAAGEIQLRYFFMKKELKYGRRISKISLVKRDQCHFPEISDLAAPGSWEVEGHYQPSVRGKIYKFTEKILHDDNDAVASWFKRHLMYAEWEAYIQKNTSLRDQIKKYKTSQARRSEEHTSELQSH